MPTLVVVSEKVLRRITKDTLPGTHVVIVTGSALKEAGVSQGEAEEFAEQGDYQWDDCDVRVDIVESGGHAFFKELRREEA